MSLGKQGETAAAQYLEAKGYDILTRNYRTRSGEIDLIAKQSTTIVFIEVKTRTSTEYGYPAEFVTYRKQQKLLKAALFYLHTVRQDFSPARFDVIEVLSTPQGLTVKNHIVNAFGR